MSTQEIKNDAALLDAISAISNTSTGLGGNSYYEVNKGRLDNTAIDELYEASSLLQKVIRYLPEDAAKHLPKWDLRDTTVTSDDVIGYLKNAAIIGSDKESPDLFDLIKEACINARLYGDCFIVLGVNDGQELNKPLDKTKIKSIEWAALRAKRQTSYDHVNKLYTFGYDSTDTKDFKEKEINLTRLRVHTSRVLRFVGTPLYGESYRNNHYMNASVFDGIVKDYIVFRQSIDATAHMVTTHETFVMRIPGIAKWLATEGFKGVYDRLKVMMRTKSVLGGLFADTKEEIQTFSHNYGNLDQIITIFLDILVGSSGMTKSKLMGSANGSALSSQSEGDRFEWASCVKNYQFNYQRPQLQFLTELVMLAKDSPFKGALLPQWEIEFDSIFEQSPVEDIDYRNKAIDYFGKLLDKGLITKKEARESLLGGIAFGIEVTLDDTEWEQEQAGNNVITEQLNQPLDKLAGEVSM